MLIPNGRGVFSRKVTGRLGGIAVVLVLVGTGGWPPGAAGTEGAGPSATHPAVMEVRDDAGRRVVLSRPPQRVAAGASFALELLMAIDHPPVLRPAVRDEELCPLEARKIPTFAVQHGTGPDLEALVAARPQLVILHTNFAAFAPAIEKAVQAPVLLLEVTSLDDVMAKMTLLGQIVGRPEATRRAVERLRQAIGGAARDLPAQKPRVLALFGTPDAFYVYRDRSYIGSMLEALHASNAAGNDAPLGGMQSLAPLDLEQVVLRKPEVILIVPHGDPRRVVGYLASHPAWQRIPAVRNNRVHIVDEALFSSNPGPRAVEALRTLRAILYPAVEPRERP